MKRPMDKTTTEAKPKANCQDLAKETINFASLASDLGLEKNFKFVYN